MSKLKHTPGPWEIKRYGKMYSLNNTEICIFDNRKYLPNYEEIKHNIKLISTAPEMLECFIDYLEWGAKTNSDRDIFENRFKQIIEKATGLKIEEIIHE